MKYAALKFNATNIGDEIQSIAAQRFLPKIDFYIFREQLNKFKSNEKVKIILNSWYMWKPKRFPPSKCIDPLLISMYFNPTCRKKILSKKGAEFLKKNGPVGCRDLSTKKWLDENGIPAYFSGCLTSTLIANDILRQKYPHDYILCINCSNRIVDYVKNKSIFPVYSFGKQFSPYIESIDRFELAKAILFMYQNARCVITTNLHTALPCLAFGVNVCLLEKKYEHAYGLGRFEGMEGFFNTFSEESFLNGEYNVNSPKPNPLVFKKYRDKMIKQCKDFTGFDANCPTLPDDYEPLHYLFNILAENHNNVRRTLYWSTKKELIMMFLLKLLKKTDRNDITSEDYLKF